RVIPPPREIARSPRDAGPGRARPAVERVEGRRPGRAEPDSRVPAASPRPPGGQADGSWVTFRVTWGGLPGADARRLLAVVCRRGNIRGSDVGAIRIEATHSLVDVARPVADRFEADAARPDPRDPRVRITRADAPAGPPH